MFTICEQKSYIAVTFFVHTGLVKVTANFILRTEMNVSGSIFIAEL